jgi:hypothetical protein
VLGPFLLAVLEKEDYWEGLDGVKGAWTVGSWVVGWRGLDWWDGGDWLVGGDIDRDVAGTLMMQRIVRRVLGIE